MNQAIRSKSLTAWSHAMLGPVVMGVASGAAWGAHEAFRDALAVPAVVLSVAAIMTPALYIGTNILGVRRSASQVASAMFASLRSSGLIMAGLAPAVAFLLISNGGLDGLKLFAALAAEAAMVLGVWTLLDKLRLNKNQGFRSSLMLTAWTIITVLLDAHLLGQWVVA